MALQHLRSGTAHKRPIPTAMSAGQIAINTNEASPGLFFKDSNGDLVKVGPVHIGTTAPNANPASTAATALVSGTIYQILTVGTTDFTTVGASTNTVGTVFTATGAGTGTGTVSGQQGVEKGEQWLDTTGGNYVLKIYDGTAWRSETGTFVDSSGDTMTGALLLDNAASASAPDLSFDGDADTGVYSPGANKLAISTGGAQRLFVDADGDVGIGTGSPGSRLEIVDGGGSGSAEVLRVKRSNGADACVFRIDLDPDLNIVKYQATGSQSGTHAFGQGGGSESMRIGSNGRVGIGTTSPTQLIDLESTAGGRIAFTDTGTRRYSIGSAGVGSSSLTIRDESGSADRIVITNAGDVGIGTSTPLEKFHINAGDSGVTSTIGGVDGAIISTSAGRTGGLIFFTPNDRSAGIFFGDPDDGNRASYKYDHAVDATIIASNNAERLRIDSSGKVGIGTSSPDEILHIKASAPTLKIEGAQNDPYTNPYGFIDFENTNISDTYIGARIIVKGSTDAARDGEIHIQTNSNGTTAQGAETNLNTAVSITKDGNVGIGTSSPGNLLSIAGSEPRIEVKDTDTNARFLIDCNSSAGSVNFRVDQDGSAASSAAIFSIDSSEKMRITHNDRLLIGTSASRSVGAPVGAVEVEGEDGNEAALSISRFNDGAGGSYITLGKARGTKAAPTIVQNNDNTGFIEFAAYDGGDLRSVCAGIHAYIDGTPGTNDVPGRLSFRTTADGSNAPTERMRIAANGDIKMAMGDFANTGIIGQNAASGDGVYIDEDGGIKLAVSRWQGTVFGVNRMGNDGDLIAFFGQGTNEGSISVSGTTVSLTGGHLSRWSQLENNAERTEILRGSVLSNLDEMCEWGEEDNEQLNRMKVSDVEGDPNVAGVFQGWDDEDETYLNDFHCAMTGDFIIRIAQGTTVARGDLLMSAGDGTAKPQGDDIVRSKTVAKVTSTTVSTTYADGSYCVPCVLMAC